MSRRHKAPRLLPRQQPELERQIAEALLQTLPHLSPVPFPVSTEELADVLHVIVADRVHCTALDVRDALAQFEAVCRCPRLHARTSRLKTARTIIAELDRINA